MKNFKEEILKLEYYINTNTADIPDTDDSQRINTALEELYENALYAVKILNDKFSSDVLNIIKIEDDLIPLLFTFNMSTTGFVLVSPQKYIFFISDNVGNIYTYGLEKEKRKPGINISGGSAQLLTINYATVNGEIVYRDSTGNSIDPQEIIYQIFRWATH